MNKSFFYRSIFLKFTITFVLTGLIPLFVLGYLSFDIFSKNIESFTISNFKQILAYSSRLLNQIIIDYDNLTKLIYSYNTERFENLGDLLTNVGEADETDNILGSRSEIIVDDFLSYLLVTNRYIQNVFLIDSELRKIFYHSRFTKQLDLSYDYYEFIKSTRTNLKKLTIIPTHRESYFFDSDDLVVTFARNYIDTSASISSDIIRGTLLIDVSINVIDSIFDQISFGTGGEIFVIDSTGHCIYGTPEGYSGKNIEWYETLKDEINGQSGFISRGDSYFIYNEVLDTNWIVIGKVHKRDISTYVIKLRNYFFIIIILCILVLTVVTVIFSKRFIKPIKVITASMKRVESGYLDERVTIKAKDEIGQIAFGFNNMVSELQSYINRVYISEIKQKEANLNYLKSQIKPHYLFNTLEVIRMAAVSNDDLQVAEMIRSMSKQLKYMVDYSSDIVMVRDEIDNILSYLDLLKHRFNNIFDFEVHITDEVLDLGILRLTLQPLVENAFFHGIKSKKDGGKIMISGEISAKTLVIDTFDNGSGLDNDTLQEIEHILSEKSIAGGNAIGQNRIGLKNVHDRIKIKFGDKYGLEIESRRNMGTLVKLHLPVIKGVGLDD